MRSCIHSLGDAEGEIEGLTALSPWVYRRLTISLYGSHIHPDGFAEWNQNNPNIKKSGSAII